MVFVNPTLADKTTEVFIIEPNDLIAASFAPGGFLAPVPAGIALLSDPGLEQGGLFAVKLRDVANQVIGFGTEQQEVDFPTARVKTTWTLDAAADMDASFDVLMQLRSMTFHYKADRDPMPYRRIAQVASACHRGAGRAHAEQSA